MQFLSSEFYQIFQNSFFIEHLRITGLNSAIFLKAIIRFPLKRTYLLPLENNSCFESVCHDPTKLKNSLPEELPLERPACLTSKLFS